MAVDNVVWDLAGIQEQKMLYRNLPSIDSDQDWLFTPRPPLKKNTTNQTCLTILHCHYLTPKCPYKPPIQTDKVNFIVIRKPVKNLPATPPHTHPPHYNLTEIVPHIKTLPPLEILRSLNQIKPVNIS